MNLSNKSFETISKVYDIWRFRRQKFKNYLHFAENGDLRYIDNLERYAILYKEMDRRLDVINKIIRNLDNVINVNYL